MTWYPQDELDCWLTVSLAFRNAFTPEAYAFLEPQLKMFKADLRALIDS